MTGNWIQFAVGMAILVAPWVFGFAGIPLAKWTDTLAGLALVLMNLWAIYGKAPAAAAVSALSVNEDEASPENPGRARRISRQVSVKPKKVEKVLINS